MKGLPSIDAHAHLEQVGDLTTSLEDETPGLFDPNKPAIWRSDRAFSSWFLES